MGDTGPCGPCSEIFYDHGPGVEGSPPGMGAYEGDRFVEIWNLVFMQYDRDEAGELTPLPKPSVDTGMGLERTAAVLQGVTSNYEIDLFRTLIGAAAEITGAADLGSNSLKVIADHARAAAFLVNDGVFPSNEGRGYVLRRIIRRALRHGHDLGVKKPFLYRMVGPIHEEMGAAFPELSESRSLSERMLKAEEERFAATLEQGMRYLGRSLEKVKDTVIPGEMAFVLYDTYGFPVDLTADIARGRGMTVDMPGYEAAMAKQRERSRGAAAKGAAGKSPAERGRPDRYGGEAVESRFTGYERLEDRAKVRLIEREGKEVEEAEEGARVAVVLDRTPLLCRERRAGGGHRPAHRRGPVLRGGRYAADGRGSRAHRPGGQRDSAQGCGGHRRRRFAAAQSHCSEPFRHAPHERGAAPRSRQARGAKGLAGRAGPAPV